MTSSRHGGRVLVDQLAIQGARCVFLVPGESFLAALDGLHDHPDVHAIVCRHEGGAAMMADAWGKATGAPGVVFVTRGPGAANAISGLHVAHQDATPMVLLIGLPPLVHESREAFQEIDVPGLLGSTTKWAAVCRDPARIPEYISRAFHLAQSGRPGPVAIGFPEDVLSAEVSVPDSLPAVISRPEPSPADMRRIAGVLAEAERPMVIVGNCRWSEAARGALESFAERFDVPVAVAFRNQDLIDNRHPCYAGHLGIAIDPVLKAAVASSDLLIILGARLGEITTAQFSLLSVPSPAQRLVHILPSPDGHGQVYRPDLAVTADAEAAAHALAELKPREPVDRGAWRRHLHDAWKAGRGAFSRGSSLVELEAVVRAASELLPEDAIITNGAGNYTAFVHRYFAYKRFRTCLAPGAGSMGYGVPAAIAGALAAPGRRAIAFAGDGCFLMTGQELATAAQLGLPVTVIVADNGMYGTIRMHQERRYPGRVSATALANPDFALMARSYGIHAETVERSADFPAALERCLAIGGPSLIHLKVDPAAIAPGQTLAGVSK